MNLLEDVTRMVSAANMFSANETIDEVPTANVKFLLLPALLGTLALKLTTGDRLEIVKTAELYFRDFLQRCKDYSIKEDIEIPPFENLEELSDNAEAAFSPRNVDMMAMARRRASKIQQYKEQKVLESQMSSLKKVFVCRLYWLISHINLQETAEINFLLKYFSSLWEVVIF